MPGALVPADLTPLRLRGDGGTVAPLRRGCALAIGGVADHRVIDGCQLVAATDLAGTSWWVPAGAFWSDAQCNGAACPDGGHPTERPRATGLATARTWTAAVLIGLCDRLGWEAVDALDRGIDLPSLTDGRLVDEAGLDAAEVIVLDGRIGHDVPTVVVLGDGVTRWGAGQTWAIALRRALFGGRAAGLDDDEELAWLGERLGRHGLRPVHLDIGNAALRSHGITRTSVQVLLD